MTRDSLEITGGVIRIGEDGSTYELALYLVADGDLAILKGLTAERFTREHWEAIRRLLDAHGFRRAMWHRLSHGRKRTIRVSTAPPAEHAIPERGNDPALTTWRKSMTEKFRSVIRHEVVKIDGAGKESPFYAATLLHEGLDRAQLVDVNRVLHGAAGQFIEMGAQLAEEKKARDGDASFGNRDRERR